MADLKICRICLHTEVKVYHCYQYQLKSYYEDILALTLDDMDNLPQYFCVQCAILLHKYHKFKEKCRFGQNIFQEVLQNGPITYDAMKTIDRSNLDVLHKSQVDKVIDIVHGIDESLPIDIIIKEEDKDNDKTEKNAVIYETKDADIEMDLPIEDTHDYEDIHMNIVITEESDRPVSKKNKKVKHKIKDKGKDSKCIDKDVNEEKDVNKEKDESNQKEKVIKRLILMDDSKWLKSDLTEEDAIQEFRLKALDEKYTGAAYKCADCFKGFSEEDMLKRHIKIRHSESQGSIECQFCKMRFKRKCRLRQHIREHYNKFKCLRCNFICVLESTALSHELFHNGVTRKCEYCGKEFRYSSTYYTHLRTHRSQFVCTLCGSSFVSEAGLHQHKRIKHCNKEKKVQEKDREVNKFCSKCDIQFETRKAFEEHLYHSTMHADENGIDIPKPINILEKSIQDKVTSLFKSRKIDPTLKSEKRGKKPTTCHQCDKHFSSQAACLKHHLQEHPGTSSCPPNLRHICEICGASLAPGSVAVHKNMHTREKIFACSTCGRQFYESVGLKRHLLTHTGEKPFQCSSCDKRFTQSASLKLHFKTFHLKEPYPKRIRRKKE